MKGGAPRVSGTAPRLKSDTPRVGGGVPPVGGSEPRARGGVPPARGGVGRGRRVRGVAAVLLALMLAGGCGVPVDSAPRDIDNPHVLPSDEPLAANAGTRLVRLYLVRAGRLVRISHRVPAPLDPQGQLQELLNGPREADSAQGLTSALTTMNVGPVTVLNRRATVLIGAPAAPGARSDEVLAYAQIVCTLTSQGAEVGTVSFVSPDGPLAVPRADGKLSEGALTIADYADLIDP
jgi:hypothetical protein